jgi:hypothetical protein
MRGRVAVIRNQFWGQVNGQSRGHLELRRHQSVLRLRYQLDRLSQPRPTSRP